MKKNATQNLNEQALFTFVKYITCKCTHTKCIKTIYICSLVSINTNKNLHDIIQPYIHFTK